MLLDGVFSLRVRRWSSATSFRFEQVESRLIKKLWLVHFNRLISVCPLEASSNQIVLVGWSPAHVFRDIPNLLCDLPCDE